MLALTKLTSIGIVVSLLGACGNQDPVLAGSAECLTASPLSALRGDPKGKQLAHPISGSGREHNETMREIGRVLTRRMAGKPPEDWVKLSIIMPVLDSTVMEIGERRGGARLRDDLRKTMRVQLALMADEPGFVDRQDYRGLADSLVRYPEVAAEVGKARTIISRGRERAAQRRNARRSAQSGLLLSYIDSVAVSGAAFDLIDEIADPAIEAPVAIGNDDALLSSLVSEFSADTAAVSLFQSTEELHDSSRVLWELAGIDAFIAIGDGWHDSTWAPQYSRTSDGQFGTCRVIGGEQRVVWVPAAIAAFIAGTAVVDGVGWAVTKLLHGSEPGVNAGVSSATAAIASSGGMVSLGYMAARTAGAWLGGLFGSGFHIP